MKGFTLEKPALNGGVERNCPKQENGSKVVGGLGTCTAAPEESREGGRERLNSRSVYQAGTLCYTPVITALAHNPSTWMVEARKEQAWG